jgi:hypothetical protein
MERIVATYGPPDHEIHVIEYIDEDTEWYQLAVRNVVIDGIARLSHVPTEDEARALLRQWTERTEPQAPDAPQ